MNESLTFRYPDAYGSARRILRSALSWSSIFVLIVTLTACATGRTLVVEPVKKTTFASAQLIEEEATVPVPPDVATSFKSGLSKKLYQAGRFTPGDGLVIKYRFIQYTAGNRFTRWFWGGIGNAGEASATVKVEFENPTGAQLGNIQVEGRIGSGFFGGSSGNALDKATDEITNYAVANFR